jgi:hypothetical protein
MMFAVGIDEIANALFFDADYHKDVDVNLNGHHRIRIIQAQFTDYGFLSCTLTAKDQGN